MNTRKLEKETLNLISFYATDISKTMDEKELFYENLQNLLDTTTNNSKTIILGDFNARVAIYR